MVLARAQAHKSEGGLSQQRARPTHRSRDLVQRDGRVRHANAAHGSDLEAREEHYPGFEWYARFWDDSYVIPATFEELIQASFDLNLL